VLKLLSPEDLIVSISIGLNCESDIKHLRSKKKYIHNGINCINKKFFPKNYTNNTQYYFVYIGRLEYQKNPLLLLEFSEILVRMKFDFILDIYGDGTYYDSMLDLISKKNLSRYVKLHGWVDIYNDVEFNKYDLGFLTSKFEGFGISIVEILNFSIPVISSNCQFGPSEIITDTSGFLFEEGNIQEFISKFLSWDSLSADSKNILRFNAFKRSLVFQKNKMINKYNIILK